MPMIICPCFSWFLSENLSILQCQRFLDMPWMFVFS
jgi:hypothetical protein